MLPIGTLKAAVALFNQMLSLDNHCIVAEGDPRVLMCHPAWMDAHGLEKPHSLVPHPYNPIMRLDVLIIK